MTYVTWRIETYTGVPTPEVTRHLVLALTRHSTQRQALWRYLRWAHQMYHTRSTPAVWLRSSASRDGLALILNEGRATKAMLRMYRAHTVFTHLRVYQTWYLWVPMLVVLCLVML